MADGSALAAINCTDSEAEGTPSSGDLSAATAVIQLDPGETVECEFVNDEAKVQIVESFTVSRVEEGKVTGEGSIACYWITLATPPAGGSVTVAVGPPANGEVTLSKSQVTLDASNWNSLTTAERSNFVCIRPVDDKIDESGPQQCWDRNSDMIGNGAISGQECGDHTDAIPHRVSSASAYGLQHEHALRAQAARHILCTGAQRRDSGADPGQ